MTKKIMTKKNIWHIENPTDFIYEVVDHLMTKAASRELKKQENIVYLLGSMDSRIEMSGFADIFYQQLSINDCKMIQEGLSEIGAIHMSTLFNEAFKIYCRGKCAITDEEYDALDPFSLSEDEGSKLDGLADQFLSGMDYEEDYMQKLKNYAIRFKHQFDA